MLMTPIALAVSVFSLVSLSQTSYEDPKPQTNNTGVYIYAALPDSIPELDATITESDARVEIIRQYLERYNSPLLGHESVIVEAADKFKLDFRLITAIAQQESNLCKIIPPETYNCWGWGIHSEGTLGFESYEEGIYTVTQGLKRNYIDLGYDTPEVIMTKYTPQSNGSWARGVSSFMSEML